MLPEDIAKAPHAVIKVFVDAMTSFMVDNKLFPEEGSELTSSEPPQEAVSYARKVVAKKFSEEKSKNARGYDDKPNRKTTGVQK